VSSSQNTLNDALTKQYKIWEEQAALVHNLSLSLRNHLWQHWGDGQRWELVPVKPPHKDGEWAHSCNLDQCKAISAPNGSFIFGLKLKARDNVHLTFHFIISNVSNETAICEIDGQVFNYPISDYSAIETALLGLAEHAIGKLPCQPKQDGFLDIIANEPPFHLIKQVGTA